MKCSQILQFTYTIISSIIHYRNFSHFGMKKYIAHILHQKNVFLYITGINVHFRGYFIDIDHQTVDRLL